MSARTATWAIFGVFFIESAVLGNWIPRIPDIKTKLALSDAAFGLCLLAMPFGTLIGLFVAAKIIEFFGGLRTTCQIFLPLWAIAFIFPVLSASTGYFIAALLVAGFIIGMVEVAMNTEADRIERHFENKIMSRCHGFWSLGSMAGALTGAAIAQVGIRPEPHFVVLMPLLAIAGFYLASQLPKLGNKVVAAEPAPIFCLPSKAIVLLCLLPIGIMFVEGAFIDWSAVFMRTILDASPMLIGITYAFFSVVMAVVRLFGDSIRNRFPERLIVQVSGLAAAIGVTLFALAPTSVVAFAGAVFSGVGVAVVYPLAISAAAARPGRSAAHNVAAMTMISFSAFLISPPLIGLVSHISSLRIAFLILAPIALVTFFLAKEIDIPKH